MHGVLIGCAAGLSLYFYILLTLTQAPSGVAVAHKALIAWCVCIGLAGLTRMGLRVLSPALILGLYVHFAYIAIWTGGIHSVAIAWFIFLPSATLLLGQKSTLFWSACSLSLMLGLSFAQNQHWLGTEIPSAQYAYWASGITISMILGVILFVLIYEKLNDAHTENLLQQTKILTQVEQQLLKTQAHKDEFIAVISHE